MRYVSLFSGIEAASVAAEPLGWEPVCFCEVDEFPSAVLAHHYPEVPNLGDITKVDWKEVIAEHGPVDVVVGGSPCQSFSVAGKREGLEGASGLMFEYIRAVSEILPRFWVWENVPGALSSSGGGDFECFLREMAGIRGAGGERYGIGWRVLDAQFFGVAQRRRRLFAIGVLGDFAGPAEILFESEGLRWNTPSSREKRKALAANARSRAAGADGGAVAFTQNQHDKVRYVGGDGQLVGALSAQPGVKQQTYLAEAKAYREIPLPCPKCGSDAKVEVDDPQEPEMFWHYSCGCGDMSCENYVHVRRSFDSREDAITNWNKQVLLCSSIDYKQTPKVNDQLCHTLTHEGDGGIHSAVAYSDCLPPWDVQSKRVHGENSVSPTLQAGSHEGQNIQPIVMASGHTNAEIGVGGGSTNPHGAQPEGRARTSNGEDVFPALCATDGSKQFIDNQSVRGGRLVLDPRQEGLR